MLPSIFQSLRVLVCCVVATAQIAAWGAGEAHATDSAELLIRQGVELRRKGNNTAALGKFRSAYELSKSARAAAQLGLCEQAMQSWLEAEQHLSEALYSESDPWVARNRQVVETSRASARANLGNVVLNVQPQTALVTLNDTVIGRAVDVPTAWVPPGIVKIKVHKDGFAPQTVERQVKAGEKVTIGVELAQESAPLPVSNSQNILTPQNESGSTDLSATSSETSPSSKGRWQPYAGWGAVGLGALSLGWGVFSYAGRESDTKEFNKSCSKIDGIIAGGTQCQTLDGDIASSTTQMTVGLIAGGVFVAAGVAVLIWDRLGPSQSQEQSQSARASCVPIGSADGASGSSVGLFCAGAF